MNKIFSGILKYSDFKKIWWAQVFSQIALNMLTFALVLHIFALTKSATSISLVMIFSAIPVAILGPFSGVLADRINYRKILVYTNFLRFLSVVLLFFAKDNILAMLEVIFIISAISQIFTPAESSSVPLIVPKEKLILANSLVMTTTYATLLIGYSIAGPILHFSGTLMLLVLCAVIFLAATFVTMGLSDFDKKETRKISFDNFASKIEKVWNEIKLGYDYIKSNVKVYNPMIKLTIGWTILGAFITILPAFGESVLNIKPTLVGPLIIAPAGIGMLISILILNKKHSFNHSKVINLGFIITAIALILFTACPLYENFILGKIFLLLFVVILGLGSTLVQVPAQTLLHLNSDENKRGRVFGVSSMQLRLATTLPAFMIGGVSDLTSPLITMILLTIAVFLYAMVLVFE